MVELKSPFWGFREQKESSPEGLAPSFATGISPFTKSGCPSSGNVFGLDSPVRHPFGGLSSPFTANSIVTTAASGTSTSSNPFSGSPVMLASTMPAHNSSIAQFGTPCSFPQSKSISGTTLSDAMFCTGHAARNKSVTSGGSSIFPHTDCFFHPPAFGFLTPNTTSNFGSPSISIAGRGALAEPSGFLTPALFGPQKPTTTATHNVFGFPNATSTGFNSQPTPFWNSPFTSSTQREGEKISNSASPSGTETSSRGKTAMSDYTPTPAPEEGINERGFHRNVSISAMPSNKDRSYEELRWDRHESKESKQKSSCEGFAPFAATSNPFPTSTATKRSVSSSFITQFTQPSWFTPSAVKLAFHNIGGCSICQHNGSTHQPAFSFPNITTTTDCHFGPPRDSAPGGESTNVSTDSACKKPSSGFIPPTPFGPLNMTAPANSTGFQFLSTPSTQNIRPSKFPFESKSEGDGEKMRPTPTICSSCRETEASTYAPSAAPTECIHATSTSVSATPDNNHKSPEGLRWQCHESKEKVGELVDPVSEMASHDPHSIYPVMMMIPVVPTLAHSFGAFPWNTISGACTGFYAPTLLGRNVPILLIPSNSLGLNCFPPTVSRGNYFPSFNIQAIPAATTDCLTEMFRRL